jgi:hypothetical protein
MRVLLACLGFWAVSLAGVMLPFHGFAQDQGAAALDAPAAPPAAAPVAPVAPEAPPTVFAPEPALAPVAPAPSLPAFEEPEPATPVAAASPPPAAQPLPPSAVDAPAPAPRPQLEPWPDTLEEGARLSCPECACERARTDYALVRHEYRSIQRKVSTKRPRLLMMAGFIGASVFTMITAMAYTQPYSNDPFEREDDARQRRVLAEGAVAISIPLALGLSGMYWFRERRREGAPYRERHRELKFQLRESKLAVRDACRPARTY